MSVARYLNFIIFSISCLTCRGDVENDVYYSIANIITKNPELSQQLLNEYIIKVIDTAKASKIEIYGESVKNVPVVDNKKTKSSKKNKNQNETGINSITEKSSCVCSGFLISNDGYILTSCDFIKCFDKFYTKIDERKNGDVVVKDLKLDVVGIDDCSNVAILKGKMKTDKNVSFADYGDSKVHKYVYQICGDPYKVEGCTEVEFKTNKKKTKKDSSNLKKFNSYSNTYSRLCPCILVDINGSLVGMRVNSGKFVNNKFCDHNSIIGYKDLKNVVNSIIKNKYYSHKYDSFDLVSVNSFVKNIKRLKSDFGCYVDRIDSSISNCGLKVGDIIIGINGRSIENVEMFDSIYNYVKNGDIEFRIIRKGSEETINVPSGFFGNIKYRKEKENILKVNGALLSNLSDYQVNLILNKYGKKVKGVLVNDCSDKWPCGKDFIITTVFSKYDVNSIDDIINVFKKIGSYVDLEKIHGKIPFVVSGFYLNDPNKGGSFVLEI